ncbi:uncharacterized protein LOC124313462 [Daphnia pulicaria]|uniref:uncharacterized protein LOC124313462 n=1 Tax=Daphnia pulicaria TaxID=35523 RepID=UPI001EEC5B37|nr:uncharacterized protein LOC124313462 [Daphnia pulicaria]
MARLYILAILLCCSQLVLTTNGHPAGEDGEWVDDISNNPEIMGRIAEDEEDDPSRSVAAPVAKNEDDGEWVDDVTGNMFIMGEDPLSQSTGLSDDMNSERKKRSVEKKILKAMKKASKKGKRATDAEREKRSPKSKMEKNFA